MAASSQFAPRRLAGPLGAYSLLIVASVLAFLAIRHFGETRAAAAARPAAAVDAADRDSPAQGNAAQAPAPGRVLVQVLLALGALIVVGQLLGWLLRWVGQPPVIGEVVAGVLLGPSLLGCVAPEAAAWLFPPDAVPVLQMLGQLGVILYMFVVGLEFNPALLTGRAHAVLTISHASIVAPFLLGALLALWIYPLLAPAGVAFTPFALFLGVAMSITAFPVLARILTDRGLQHTPLGTLALTCAAADDATAWCLLAFVVGVTRATGGSAIVVVTLTIGYVLLLVLLIRPLGLGLARRGLTPRLPALRLAAALVGLLLSAVATEWIGIHAVFGAFILGAILPHDGRLARELTARIEPLTSALLLPAFFAYTGLRTELGLLAVGENWLLCAAIVAVATLGKFGGTLVAARGLGIARREAAALGILMNTRGLMELIVLGVGLELGVISPALFAMMVVMAIVTTLATAPLLSCLERSRAAQPDRQTVVS